MYSLYDHCEFNINHVHFKSCRSFLDVYVRTWNCYSKCFRGSVVPDFTCFSSGLPTSTCVLYLKFKVNICFSHAHVCQSVLYCGLVIWWLKWSDARSSRKYTEKRTFHTWNTKCNRSVVEHLLLFTDFWKNYIFMLQCQAWFCWNYILKKNISKDVSQMGTLLCCIWFYAIV